MNKVYFVRHAKPDFSVYDDLMRPLTIEGLEESKKIKDILKDKKITRLYCSPYKRSIDTIKDLAENLNLQIKLIDDFRERKISNEWIEDFNSFSKRQWDDFEYKLEYGESLKEVQERNIRELQKILRKNDGENIVIGTHGTSLSCIINYFDKSFGYMQFEEIKNVMPLIVCMEFDGLDMINISTII